MNNEYVHLTNYAINKHSEAFVFNKDSEKDSVGHKRSFTSVLESLRKQGFAVEGMLEDIKKIIVKTLCAVQPSIAHSYRICQQTPGMCFEVLGFDILIDKSLKPWLLEVNHSPSFSADSPLDAKIKTEVIKDTLKMLKVSAKDKAKYETKKKNDIINRSVYGKQAKGYSFGAKSKKERLGGFSKIFPAEEYLLYLEGSQKVWSDKVRYVKVQSKARPVSSGIRRNSTGLNTQGASKRTLSPSFLERLSKPVQRETKTIIYKAKKEGRGNSEANLIDERALDGLWKSFRTTDQPMTIKSVLPVMESFTVRSNKLFVFNSSANRSLSKNRRK